MINLPSELNREMTKQKALNCYTASYTNGNLLNAYLNAAVILRQENLQKVIEKVLDDLARDYKPDYFLDPSLIEFLTLEEIAVIAKRIITTHYRLLFSRPFKQDFSITADRFWERAKEWVSEGGVVIWGIDNKWLAIHEMTRHQAFFLGGTGCNIINKDQFCSSVNLSPHYYLQTVRFIRRLEVVYE